jgi:hypothetical protein
MKGKDGFVQAYNVQLAVDAKPQVIELPWLETTQPKMEEAVVRVTSLASVKL